MLYLSCLVKLEESIRIAANAMTDTITFSTQTSLPYDVATLQCYSQVVFIIKYLE